MRYKELIAATERVRKHDMVRTQKLDVIEEGSLVSSLDLPNNTDQLPFSQAKYSSFYTAATLKSPDGAVLLMMGRKFCYMQPHKALF